MWIETDDGNMVNGAKVMFLEATKHGVLANCDGRTICVRVASSQHESRRLLREIFQHFWVIRSSVAVAEARADAKLSAEAFDAPGRNST